MRYSDNDMMRVCKKETDEGTQKKRDRMRVCKERANKGMHRKREDEGMQK